MRYFILGLGQVGQCFLSILIQNRDFNPNNFYCIDKNIIAKDLFIKKGGLSNHFILKDVDKNNYLEILRLLNPGDYLLDFSMYLKNLDILDYCLQFNIHYLFTADSSWKDDNSWRTVHQHYLSYVELKNKYDSNRATSIIEFGMNPGLVSIFAKECLKEIVDKDNSLYVKIFRKKLQNLLKEDKFNLVAKKLGVELIEEIDVDNQKLNIEYKNDTIYSTWNVDAYYCEAISSPEVAYSSENKVIKHSAFYDVDLKDKFIALQNSGITYKELTYYSQGEIEASLICHEEIFSMRRYLSINGYSPTVIFLYKPCEYALRSLEENLVTRAPNNYLIKKADIVSGGEEVGVAIQGKRFKTRYYANYLDNQDCENVATIYQVGVGAYCAFKYLQNHPKEGMLFPEELNSSEIMNTAKQYLQNFISIEINKIHTDNI